MQYGLIKYKVNLQTKLQNMKKNLHKMVGRLVVSSSALYYCPASLSGNPKMQTQRPTKLYPLLYVKAGNGWWQALQMLDMN